MRYPKLRELKEAVISLFSPAYTSKFPKEPHAPFPNFRGKPVVDDSACVGCETCANVCPAGAITFIDDKDRKIRTIQRDFGKCIFCGECEEHCITQKGVQLSDAIFDLSTFNRDDLVEYQEKELLLCRNCGAVITTKEHIRFLYEKLGARAYASFAVQNILNERLQLASEDDITVDVVDGLKRKDMFNALCPDCLRTALLKSLV